MESSQPASFEQQYLDFLWNAPSPFHAVKQAADRLLESGFVQVHEREEWELKPGQGYFFVRDQTALFAWIMPTDPVKPDTPFTIWGAHTDSPTYKVKPKSEIGRSGYKQVAIEPYGSAIAYSWFDRPLRLAGRVIVKDDAGLHSKLLRSDKTVAFIPSLAIHNWQTRATPPPMDPARNLDPVIGGVRAGEADLRSEDMICSLHLQSAPLLSFVKESLSETASPKSSIVSWELEFSLNEKPVLAGVKNEFVLGSRQDNLVHCFAGVNALLDLKGKSFSHVPMICLFNNEEIGSLTREGARGHTVEKLIERIAGPLSVHLSLFISADTSHGLHPNYSSASDPHSVSVLGKGPTLKIDVRQGYACSAPTSAYVTSVAIEEGIKLQSVSKLNGTPGGGTIGPMTAGHNDIRTLDLGVPLLGMHSICETSHIDDVINVVQLARALLSRPGFDPALISELE